MGLVHRKLEERRNPWPWPGSMRLCTSLQSRHGSSAGPGNISFPLGWVIVPFGHGWILSHQVIKARAEGFGRGDRFHTQLIIYFIKPVREGDEYFLVAPTNSGCHETRSFLVSRGGRCSKSWSKARPVTCGADAPRVSSGVSRWMFAMLFLAAFRTCSTGLWSGAYGWQMNRGDALQQPAGLVAAGQCFRVVGSGVVRDDRDLLCGVLHGQDRAHPRGLPLDQPFLHRPLSALNQFSAMMPTSTPREAYRVASAFIRTNT